MKMIKRLRRAIAFASISFVLFLVACGNNRVEVQAYALLGGDTYSPIPVKVYVEKSGSLSFAHFADDPDNAYPVYKDENGEYQYYFNVKGPETVTYCFNY